MDRYTLTLFWILIVAIILLSTPTKYVPDKKEGFHTYFSYFKNYCPSCGWRSRYSCSKCINCGYCITAKGVGSCESGDSSGPYFREDCMIWDYGSNYDYYPGSTVYPIYKTKTIYPYSKYK